VSHWCPAPRLSFNKHKSHLIIPSLKASDNLLGMVVHAYNPSPEEAEAGGLPVQGQLGLHSKMLSPNKQTNNPNTSNISPLLQAPPCNLESVQDLASTHLSYLALCPSILLQLYWPPAVPDTGSLPRGLRLGWAFRLFLCPISLRSAHCKVFLNLQTRFIQHP
jgi:hypothetical protein